MNDHPLSYEEAKELARHQDPAVRKRLAEREDIRPEILYFLAGDPSPEVRLAITQNQSVPERALVNLAQDSDPEIRSGLAGKLSGMIPNLNDHQRDKLESFALQALEILATDQLTKIRRVLAETLKDVAEAPESVIRQLARDSELEVAAPVLESSPVLSDDDLIEIISSGICSGAIGAIGKRSFVSDLVSDAIVKTDDVDAISNLLNNTHAQIREDTLDTIVEKARKVPQWHKPLVNRPVLPENAIRKLATFVTENLLAQLAKRNEIDSELLDEIRSEMARRLSDQDNRRQAPGDKVDQDYLNLKREFSWLFQEPPQITAAYLKKAGRLNERVIQNAVNAREWDFAIACLANLAEVPLAIAQRIISMRSPRGVLALCWKAQCTPELALSIQTRIARIAPNDIISPAQGKYPLSPLELQWQIDFFNNMGA